MRVDSKDRSRHSTDGFIIIAVLWILAALATLVSIYAVAVNTTAISMRMNSDRVQSKALLQSALELTAWKLSSVGADDRPTQGAFVFTVDRSHVTVEFKSEAARIDLNTAPKALLAGLFAGFGASREDADYYADRIVGWRAPGSGQAQDSETFAYRASRLDHAPRLGPFVHVGELWLVLGLPPELVERALPHVTVFSGRADINILDASPEVVAALPGMTPELLADVLRQRGAGLQNAQRTMGLIGDRTLVTSAASRAVRVSVRVDTGTGRSVRADVVILPIDNATEPFRVLSWSDDFDGPI